MFVCERERRGRRAPPRPLSHLPPIARSILPRTSSLKVAAKPWALSPSLACCSAPGKGGGRRWVRKGVNAARAGLVVGWCPPPVFFFFCCLEKQGHTRPRPRRLRPRPQNTLFLAISCIMALDLTAKRWKVRLAGERKGRDKRVCVRRRRGWTGAPLAGRRRLL